MMQVRVTRAHITEGKRDHNLRNPIALALQESDECAVVTKVKAHLRWGVYELPIHAQSWLSKFNACQNVQPLDFLL